MEPYLSNRLWAFKEHPLKYPWPDRNCIKWKFTSPCGRSEWGYVSIYPWEESQGLWHLNIDDVLTICLVPHMPRSSKYSSSSGTIVDMGIIPARGISYDQNALATIRHTILRGSQATPYRSIKTATVASNLRLLETRRAIWHCHTCVFAGILHMASTHITRV